MKKIFYFPVFLFLFVSVVVLGTTQVFATSVADSPWQTTVKNYAKIASIANCNDPGNGGDADNDGICDNWESTSNPGLHISYTDTSTSPSTTYVYNLSCNTASTIANDPWGDTVCPSPNKKDIYVELDWMTGHAPNSQAITDVVKAFDTMNIALHVIGGENSATNSGDMSVHYCFLHPAKTSNTLSPITNNQCTFTGSTAPSQSLSLLKRNFFGTSAERIGNTTFCPSAQIPPDATNAGPVQNANSYNCLTAKRQVFHYVVIGNNLAINTGTGIDSFATAQSGWGEVPGNDASVTLGSFTNGVGSIDEQEGTIMHELGHNLGLHHGGDVNPSGTNENDNNCKPNYHSVMSYMYEFRKTGDMCRPLAFSNNNLNPSTGPLNERGLSDSNIDPNGIATYPSSNTNPPDNPNMTPACPTSGERKFVWSSASGIQNTTSSNIDWNMNGPDTGYQLNINNFPAVVGCNTSTLSTSLSGFNDTDFIYHGGASAANPLVFRTSAFANFVQGSVSGTLLVDVSGGEITENEQSSTSSQPPPQLPSPPTGLGGTAISSSRIDLTWISSDGGSSIMGYKIERNSGSGFVTIMANTGSTATSFSDTTVTASTSYTYQVSAINNAGTSNPSNSVQITTPPPNGGLDAMITAAVTIGVIIAISIIVARRP